MPPSVFDTSAELPPPSLRSQPVQEAASLRCSSKVERRSAAPHPRFSPRCHQRRLFVVAGILLLLAAFTFWVMDHGTQEANLQNRLEDKKELKPLVTAPMKPRGGGMIEQPPANATPSNSTNTPPPLPPPAVLPPPAISPPGSTPSVVALPATTEGAQPMAAASTHLPVTTPAR